ncbi:hypothetical protein [Streptomyces sp. NPDC004296]|uniref:hypothetical protein n=1 Tax=Streptomyces sp. NPDC004296 TaxID=3364697 RepID=UPI0036BD6784
MILSFSEEAGAPKVTGEWAAEETARTTFRRWIGLYGSGTATIRVEVEDDDGSTVIVDTWPAST